MFHTFILVQVLLEGYQQDFEKTYETLDNEQKEWLQSVLRREYPQGHKWLKEKLESVPVTNVDKVIKAELFSAKNEYGDFLIIAKRESGRKLIQTLYNFALSFEHQKIARNIHNLKPEDFKYGNGKNNLVIYRPISKIKDVRFKLINNVLFDEEIFKTK